MTPRPPLPGRILIPVANPATAEELIRIGAALLDPRAGELTALGIVEVPEEMPLSEGATKARQARRLLQKVLDYAPEGTHVRPVVRIGRRAAQGIVEAAVELEADLVIFGWGGRPGGRSASGARGPRGAAGSGAGTTDAPDQPAQRELALFAGEENLAQARAAIVPALEQRQMLHIFHNRFCVGRR